MKAGGETIELLTRYAGGENRLTAALTALLRQSDVSRRYLIQSWLAGGTVPEGPICVTCQRPVGKPGGVRVGYVDLELLIAGRLVIWIEAKLGSGLSGTRQLSKYLEALPQVHNVEEAFVVLLAPAASQQAFPKTDPIGRREPRQTGAFFASWQQVHEQLTQAIDIERNAEVKWLGGEVLAYMTKQGLQSASNFRAEHATALQHIDEAYHALQRVLEAAADNVSRGYREHEDKTPVKSYPYWDYTYKPTPKGRVAGWRRDARFMWWVEPPRDDMCAGVVWQGDKGPRSRRSDSLWVSGLLAADDDWMEDHDSKWHWVVRRLPFSGLANASELNEQAAMLSDFVLETFALLNRD